MTRTEDVRRVARWINGARCAVAFTGAGISTESGIPDFRSPGGIWANAQPVMYEDFLASAAARHEYWRQKCTAHRDYCDAQPNEGHRVLADWERRGRLQAVVTQNIDGLHQLAGSRRVLELHGTARRIACQSCSADFDPQPLVDAFLETDVVPECPKCGGMLKHATVSFGQSLPQDLLTEAADLSSQSDIYLALGSSLVVEPAASLPRLAVETGARLVIINRDPTDQDESADAVLHKSIGQTLRAIDAAMAEERA